MTECETRVAKNPLDTGETPEAAALCEVRAVRADIGMTATIVAPLGSVNYTYAEDGRRRCGR